MNVEIGAEAALFPEKEYIDGIAVAVQFLTRIIMHNGIAPNLQRRIFSFRLICAKKFNCFKSTSYPS
jgi:hypothetical protein